MSLPLRLTTEPPVRIRSLDGDGNRGLSSLLILEKMMYLVKDSNGLSKVRFPCKDLNCNDGIGTGECSSVIAIMLNRQNITIDQCIQMYKSPAESSFIPKQTNDSKIYFVSPFFISELKSLSWPSSDSDSESSVLKEYCKNCTTLKQINFQLGENYLPPGIFHPGFNNQNCVEGAILTTCHKLSIIAANKAKYFAEKKDSMNNSAQPLISSVDLSSSRFNEQQGTNGRQCSPSDKLDEKEKQCLLDLCERDPLAEKKHIEERRGGLLKDCYKWILEHADFQRFKADSACRVLWIKGDPGKGKTMLLCGIISELESDPSVSLSYFFCQAVDDSRLSTATSVLRGLIHHLAFNNPQLMKHLRSKNDNGKRVFSNGGTWHELYAIVTAMLNDPSMKNVILVVDALDECGVERQRLLDYISISSPAKWIVSSRNCPAIEQSLNNAKEIVKIHLEVNQDPVFAAVESYIKFQVNQVAAKKRFNNKTKASILKHLRSNANGNFLWVALVFQELSSTPTQEPQILEKLKSFPSGLDSLYEWMLGRINQSDNAQICKEILATALVLYRPVTLEELQVLVEGLAHLERDKVEDTIKLCGPFLAIHGTVVSFVHQSAKDYLLNISCNEILPSGIEHQHRMILVRSMDLLLATLKRDIYDMQIPGRLINEVSAPNPDPLSPIQYCCIFWINHLHDSAAAVILSEQDRILKFFEERYLQWLEALSLLGNMSAGVSALQQLELYLQGKASHRLQEIIKDAHRFLLSHVKIIELAPLQVYSSALIFSPTKSLIRQRFSREEPDWIGIKPRVEPGWNDYLQTLKGHDAKVTSVVFSNNGRRLASGSYDKTVKIWDTTSGTCLHTTESHDRGVTSVVFSNDGQRLASGSFDKTVKIWDTTSGTCLHTLEGHHQEVTSVVFSNDGQRLASGSFDKTVKIWDTTSGACLHTLEGHERGVRLVVLSNDGQRLASGSDDTTVKIWDATFGTLLHALEGHDRGVTSVVFSNDEQRLASGSFDKTLKIWDATSGVCLHTLEGHHQEVASVVFSNDSEQLASGSHDKTANIWDVASGTCLHTLRGGADLPRSMVSSHDGKQLASGSDDSRVKIWDVTSGKCLHTLEGHDHYVASVVFSKTGQRLASGSWDKTAKIWDATSGVCLHTLEGHDDYVASVVFSNDGQRLASGSDDTTVKIWDATSGVCLHTLEGHHQEVTSVVFSNDGQRLASGSDDSTVKIWDSTSGTCLQTLEGHDDWVTLVVFSNDGRRLASGSWDKTIKIWDATSGAYLRTFEGHDAGVGSLVFSNDRQRLASGSHDKTVKIWDAISGTCLHTLEAHDQEVTSLVFSNNGCRLASASMGTTVKIWDLDSGVCQDTVLLGQKIPFSLDPFNYSYYPLNVGLLDLDLFTSSGNSPPTNKTHPSQTNLPRHSFNIDGAWVMEGEKRLFWLPPGYRPINLHELEEGTVSQIRVALCTPSNHISILGFRFNGWHGEAS